MRSPPLTSTPPLPNRASVDCSSGRSSGARSKLLLRRSYTWGMGFQGQLGASFKRGDTKSSAIPVPISIPSSVGVCQVACGGFHTAVLDENGCVFTWGEANHGQARPPATRDTFSSSRDLPSLP